MLSTPQTRLAFSSRTRRTSSTIRPASRPTVTDGTSRWGGTPAGADGVNIDQCGSPATPISSCSPKVSRTTISGTVATVPWSTGTGKVNQSLP